MFKKILNHIKEYTYDYLLLITVLAMLALLIWLQT